MKLEKIEETIKWYIKTNKEDYGVKEDEEFKELERELKVIENSIPKEVIEDKIKELKRTPRREFCNYDDFTYGKIVALERLLEELN